MPYKYNPNTGEWNYTDTNPSEDKNGGSTGKGGGGGGSLIPPPELEKVPDTAGAGKTSSGGGKDDKSTSTQTDAQKRFLELEYKILKGNLEVLPNLNYRARTTIGLDGLGRYLSGVYYIDSVQTNFSNNGLSQTLSLLKNGFGDTMKIRENSPKMIITDQDGKVISTISTPNKYTPLASTVVKGTTNTATVGQTNAPKKPVTTQSTPQRTHILKSGESLWSLAQKYYGDGNKWKTIAKANGIAEKDVTKIPNGKRLIIP